MKVKQTPWGTWDHLPLDAVVYLFRDFPGPWWVAGGYVIDAFAGSGRREHDDIDISVFATDHLLARQHLAAWDLHAADPPGTLRPWPIDEVLPPHVHDIWARGSAGDAWRFQLMLNPGGPEEFVCRRDERIRLPMNAATWEKDGVRYLVPELQLLFKAKGLREKDQQDFDECLPLLAEAQRSSLAGWLTMTAPGHEWIERL